MRESEKMDMTGFTVSLALVDAIPVLLFGGSCILIALLFHSVVFLIGACLCLLAGTGKVLWKLIVAAKKKNVLWLNAQFRYVMILGFFCMLLSVVIEYREISLGAIWNAVIQSAAIVFFVVGIIGIIAMVVLGRREDQGARANWMEQITNTVAQLGFFLGLLVLVIG